MKRALLLFCLPLAACDQTPQEPAARTHSAVYTTFYPTTYFAERIAGGLVPVICPLPADADPIFWRPSREALAAYQSAELIVLNGAGLEKWVETASLPARRILQSCQLGDDEVVHYEDTTVHRHGPEGEHTHKGVDGHTWLDPEIAARQAKEIYSRMIASWPEHSASMNAHHEALSADLAALADRAKSLKPPPLLASHPAYNYVARRYGWDIENLDLDPEAMPDDQQLADLRARLETHPAKILLWESPPLPEAAAMLESEFGVRSIVFSPCETRPAEGQDYLSVMNANLDRLAKLGSS